MCKKWRAARESVNCGWRAETAIVDFEGARLVDAHLNASVAVLESYIGNITTTKGLLMGHITNARPDENAAVSMSRCVNVNNALHLLYV